VLSYYGNNKEAEKNYIFSNGAIGLINDLLNEESDSNLSTYLQESKELLGSTSLERLILIDSLSKDKESLTYRLFCLKQISKVALHQSIKKDQSKQINYWLGLLYQIQKTEDNLSKGANTKLLLTDLFLRM
jgi:hypothetical protein